MIPIATSIGTAIFNPVFYTNTYGALSDTVLFFLFFADGFLKFCIAFIYLYFIGKLPTLRNTFMDLFDNVEIRKKFYKFLKSLFFITMTLAFAVFFQSIAVAQLSNSPVEKVVEYSYFLMNLDHAVFGSYASFAIQQLAQYPLLDYLFLYIYVNMSVIMVFVFLALLMTNKEYFRRYVLSIFIVAIISIPLWYSFPGISPDEMYFQNITNSPIPTKITEGISQYEVSAGVAAFTTTLQGRWSLPDYDKYAVTNFPSMHVAWGLITAYFGMLLWRPLIIFFIPWAVINSLSTIYTLQHYAVDILGGFAVGFATIFVTGWLMRYEKKHYKGGYEMFYVIDIMHSDMKKLCALLVQKLDLVYEYVTTRGKKN